MSTDDPVMDPSQIRRFLSENTGKTVRLEYDGHTELLIVTAVNHDGLLCRFAEISDARAQPEFWLAFSHITGAYTAT